MIARFATLTLLALAAWAPTGCASSVDDALVGVWVTDQKETKVPAIAVPGIERKVKAFLSASMLKLRSDHTFVLATNPMSMVDGTWKVEGHALQLKPTKGSVSGPFGSLGDERKGEILAGNTRIRFVKQTPVGELGLVLRKSA